ncbi:hypothetical protein [Microbacterium sp. LWH11-1.2]|uniref:hypothetical protein n=1 Tax=Microbacterium sp. LWH11-1.2 TaxID=3135258 RepID=UPI003138D4F8
MPITLLSDVTEAPFVEVLLEDLIPDAAFVTVYRLAGGREFQMRGAVKARTAGSFTRVDFEVPFNIPATYRAELFDDDGNSLGFTDSASITLNVEDSWMHNPLNPRGGVKIQLGGDSASRILRPTPGVISRPKGRRVGVVLSEPRHGVTGLYLDVQTYTDADADLVQAMCGDDGQPPVLCVRLGSRDGVMRVPQPLFLSVLSAAEVDITHQWGGGAISHQIEGDEVDPPIPGLFVPLLTRADLNAFFPTRAALNSAGLTRSDINRLYSLAGTAG